MLITDQVATAPCTDPLQADVRLFTQSGGAHTLSSFLLLVLLIIRNPFHKIT